MTLLPRFLITLLLFCTLVTSIFLVSVGNAQDQKFVAASVVNVRTGAGLSFPVLGKVSQGEALLVVESVGNWAQILLPERVAGGWIRTDFLASQ